MNYHAVRSFLLATCLFALSTASTQKLKPTPLTAPANEVYNRYMQKRAAYKTIGWLHVGTGVALGATFYLVNNANGWNGPDKLNGMSELGIATAALSTPWFIMAGVEKRKAKLALKGEVMSSARMLPYTTYPALSIKVTL